MSEPLDQIREIRGMMERSSKFLSLSGLSGVSAGICGLLGAWHLYFNIGKEALSHNLPEIAGILIRDGFVVLAAALSLAIFFTVRKARKLGYTVSGPATRYLLKSMAVPLVTGGVLCLGLIYYELYWLCLSVSLVFYGLALVNASRYTVNETYSLGLVEIALGLAAFFLPAQKLVFWAIGFGLMHIVYGLVMYFRYDRQPSKK